MIGGIDLIIPTKQENAVALDCCALAVTRFWSEAVFEDATTGQYLGSYDLVPFTPFQGPDLKELFAYQSESIKDRWDEEGAVPELANTMIHLICCDDALIVVVDNPAEETIVQMLSAFRGRLSRQFDDTLTDNPIAR